MVKVQLRETYIYDGTIYAAGEADVPEEMKQALTEKGALNKNAPTTQQRVETEALATAIVPEKRGS